MGELLDMTVESEQRVGPVRSHSDAKPAGFADGIDALTETRSVRRFRWLVAKLEANWALSAALILGTIAAMSLF